MSRASDGRNGRRGVDDIEDRVDSMIDSLRDERRPADPESVEEAELLEATRLAKSVKKQAEPSPGFGEKLVASTVEEARQAGKREAASRSMPSRQSEGGSGRGRTGQNGAKRSGWKPYARLIAGLAAALVLFVTMSVGPKLWNNDVAYAMSKAVGKIGSYHGVLEKSYTTLSGDGQVIRKVEVWSSGNMYATKLEDGTLTVNNGQKKWQVRPDDKVVAVLPIAPDPDRSGLDLRDQAKRAMEYPHEVVGEDVVAGRNAVCLEITPPGGLPYHLWVDAETDLPLQLRTAVHNGIQTTYTYSEFEANVDIDGTVFEYEVPGDFAVVDNDPGQEVATPTEALGIAGFVPVLPEGFSGSMPIVVHSGAARLIIPGDDGLTIVTEKPSTEGFEPVSYAALGTAAGGPLEVLQDHLRWQQDGLEIVVEGPDRVAIAKLLAPDLVMPEDAPDPGFAPEIQVPVDMEIATNDQQQVDGGHSPWQQDPVSVALTFVNTKVAPDGSGGEPQVDYGLFSVEFNDGVRSIVSRAEGPVSRVYLQRLVRQDESGIWSVVGYDPR